MDLRNWRMACAAASLLAANVAVAGDCPGGHCQDKKVYPRFEHFYIKKFNGPTIACNSCNGYFKTKWAQWEQVCPDGESQTLAVPAYVAPEPPAEPVEKVAPPKAMELPPKIGEPAKPAVEPAKPAVDPPKPPQTLPPMDKKDPGKSAMAPATIALPVAGGPRIFSPVGYTSRGK